MISKQNLTLTSLLSVFALPISASELIITPFFGGTAGGHVEDHDGVSYDLEASEHYAISIERTMDLGRVGFFLSTQNVEPEKIDEDIDIHYFQFQSSVVYPTRGALSSYVGVGIGASYVDAAWVDDNVGFSAAAFGGLEYHFTDNVSLNAQLRWMGTSVDNDTTGRCVIAGGVENCTIRFENEWMNQVQSNVGLSIKF